MNCLLGTQTTYSKIMAHSDARGTAAGTQPRGLQAAPGPKVSRADKPPPPSKPDANALRTKLQRSNAAKMSSSDGVRRPPLPVPRQESPRTLPKHGHGKLLQRGGSVLDEMMLAHSRSVEDASAIPPRDRPPRVRREQSLAVIPTGNTTLPEPRVSPQRPPRPPRPTSKYSSEDIYEIDSDEGGEYVDPNEIRRTVKLPPAREMNQAVSGGYITPLDSLPPKPVSPKPVSPRHPPTTRSSSFPVTYTQQPVPPRPSPKRSASLARSVDEVEDDEDDYAEPFDDNALVMSLSPGSRHSPSHSNNTTEPKYHVLEANVEENHHSRPGYESPHQFNGSTNTHKYSKIGKSNASDHSPYSRVRSFIGGDSDDDEYDYNEPIVGTTEEALPLLDGEPTAWFHGAITRQEAENRLENAPPGAYLLRIGGRHLGYALSIRHRNGFRHYVIEQVSDQQYELRGNGVKHKSIHNLVLHFHHNAINSQQERLRCPCNIPKGVKFAK